MVCEFALKRPQRNENDDDLACTVSKARRGGLRERGLGTHVHMDWNRLAWRVVVPMIAFALVGWSWAFASPVGSSADEDFHLTSTWCAWSDHESCVTTDTAGVVLVPQKVAQASCFALANELNARCTWLLTDELVESSRINPTTGGYPPVFYATMRAFVGPDVARSVLIMRMVNVLIAAAVLGLALATAPVVIRRAVAVLWMVSFIPVGAFFIASVNPSSWAIAGLGLFWAFLWSLVRLPKSSRWQRLGAVLGALISIALALGARADAMYVVALSVMVVVIMEFRRIRALVSPLWLVVSLAITALALGAFAWIFRVGGYLNQFTVSFPPGNAETDQPNPVVKTLLEFPAFVAGIFGGQQPWTQRESVNDWGAAGYSWHGFTYGVGAVDVINPSISAVMVGAAVAGVVFVGLGRSSKRKLLSLSLLGVAFIAQVILMRALVGFGAFWSGGVQWSLQPRYFLPLAMVIVAVTVVSFPATRAFLTRVQSALLATVLSVAAITSLMATTARYVHGQDHSWLQFAPEKGWWWSWGPSPTVLITIGGIASVVYMATLAYASRESLTRSSSRKALGRHSRRPSVTRWQ